MAASYFITNARIVNEGEIFAGDVIIRDGLIHKVFRTSEIAGISDESKGLPVIDAGGKFLIPGVIDDQVHFREPGLTH
jgi:dihydroorotase